jgi:hypothetical protein
MFLRNIGLFPSYTVKTRRSYSRYIFTLKLYKLQPSTTIETPRNTGTITPLLGGRCSGNIPGEWPAVDWGDTTQF